MSVKTNAVPVLTATDLRKVFANVMALQDDIYKDFSKKKKKAVKSFLYEGQASRPRAN